MAGIDNSVFMHILLKLSPREKQEKEIAEDLLAYDSNLQSILRNGDSKYNAKILENLDKVNSCEEQLVRKICKDSKKKSSNNVYWPDLLSRSNSDDKWRSCKNSYIDNEEERPEFARLRDKDIDNQPFPPPSYVNDYCFSSVAYDVFYEYMQNYAAQHGKGKTKQVIQSCLEELYVPNKLIDEFSKQSSFAEIAKFTISAIKESQRRADHKLSAEDYNPIAQKEIYEWFKTHPNEIPKEYQRKSLKQDDLPKLNDKKLLFSVACIALILISALFFSKLLPPPPVPPQETEVSSTAVEDSIPLAADDNYNITLTASSTMPLRDFNSNIETIKNRLDLLCDGEEYIFEMNNQSIELCLPKSVFHDEDPEEIMIGYIAQAVHLYLVDEVRYGFYSDASQYLDRNDIESVSVKTGSINGLDVAKFDINTEIYPYIEIVLTEEGTDKVSSIISDWTEPVLAHDITDDQWIYFSTFLDLENRAIYLPGNEDGADFAELMVYLYTEDPLTESFYVDVKREIEWERPAEAIYPGVNQCDLKDLQGPTVQVVYTSYKEDKTSGDWVDSEVGFKKRLDHLEQPYAFGTFISSNGYINVAIRTSPSRMGAPIMSLLSCNKSDLLYVCENKHVVCEAYDTATKIITKDDGSREYSMETLVSDWGETTNLRDLLPELKEGENCELKLCLEFVPVLSAYVDNSLEEKQVSFTHLSFNNHEELSSSNEWVLKLIEAVIGDSRIITLIPDSYEFYDEQGNIIDDGVFGIHYAEYIDKLNDTMKALNSDMWYSYSSADPGCLSIFIYLPVDESLPQASVDMAEKIFLASDFENSFLNTLNITLIDEDNFEKERARIFFNKYNYQEKIHYSFIFMNGRLDKYSAEFESAIKSSSLFADMESWQ